MRLPTTVVRLPSTYIYASVSKKESGPSLITPSCVEFKGTLMFVRRCPKGRWTSIGGASANDIGGVISALVTEIGARVVVVVLGFSR